MSPMETAPNPNDPNAGAGELDTEDTTQKGSLPDGSEDGSDEVSLADLGVDEYVAQLPQDVKEAASQVFAEMKRYLHMQREADASLLREFQEKADRYDQMVASGGLPRPYQAASEPRPAPVADTRGKLLDPDALAAAAAADPAKFAAMIEDAIERGSAAKLDKFRSEVVAPMEDQAAIYQQIQAMDAMFPDWKKDIVVVRQALTANPSLDLRTAYERFVVIPKHQKELARLKVNQSQVLKQKKDTIAKLPMGVAGSKGKDATAKYTSVDDAVLASLQELQERGRSQRQ